MGSGTNKKIKVVWICHFINQTFNSYFKKYLNEKAPWIDQLIKLFENNSDIELYIIAPNLYNGKYINIQFKGIYFHFFKNGFPYLNHKIENFFQIHAIIGYYFNKKRVEKIIDRISPDVIHLHGTENAYYSATILPLLEKYPNLITIQGFISSALPVSGRAKFKRKYQIKTEQNILSCARNFGIRAKFMEGYIKKYNQTARFYWHNYPINFPKVVKDHKNNYDEYDIVFFARLSKDKGIEDLIKATSIIKKVKEDVSVLIIGSTGRKYLKYLKELCLKLNVIDNVLFYGFMKTQEELYREVIKAKISVLPTYHDIIPGTIIESMLLKLPVVTYAVGGIPDLNSDQEIVIQVEKGNIGELVNNILRLLNSAKLRNNIANRAYTFSVDRFNNISLISDLKNIYKTIANVTV